MKRVTIILSFIAVLCATPIVAKDRYWINKSDWEGVSCTTYNVIVDYAQAQECVFPNANLQQVYDIVKRIGRLGKVLKPVLPTKHLKYQIRDCCDVEYKYRYKSLLDLEIEVYYNIPVTYIELVENNDSTWFKITYSRD